MRGERVRTQAARLRVRRGSHRYPLVLLLVFVALVFGLASPDTAWARALNSLWLAGSLVLVLWTSDARLWLRRFAFTGTAIGVLFMLAAGLFGGEDADAGVRLIGALFIFIAPLALVHGVYRQVRGQGRVTIQTVAGVLAIYVMIGMFFAAISSGIAAAGSGQWFAQDANPVYKDFLYFSFVTLATVGYGDLTAATSVGRALAVAEAILGQLYLVSVVAVIVSNLRAGRPPAGEDDQSASR